jgi:tetratricopeptide (TPR) repeat protein
MLSLAACAVLTVAAEAQAPADSRQIAPVVTDEQRAAITAEEKGDAVAALAAADRLEALARASAARGPAYAQALLATAWQVRTQFLAADALLARPEPTSDQLAVHQLWRLLRVAAMAREGRTDAAEKELHLMRLEALRDRMGTGANPQIRIAEHVAIGRLNFAQKNYRGAAQRFARAVEIEAKLGAGEGWHQPPDSALGAALLKAGDAREARAAFGRALARRPDNLWALWGRAQADKALGDTAAAERTLAEVERRWAGDRQWLSLDRL